MYCNELESKLDDFLDGDLATEQAQALELHAHSCQSCAALLEERTTLRHLLTDLPVVGPSEDFFERALAAATTQANEQRHTPPGRQKTWFTRAHGAMAAAIVVVMLTGFVVQSSLFVSSDIPAVTITMHEVTPVNLQFASEVRLEDARLSLQLPEGVELAGYTGRRQLSWRTDLREGNNLLQLPLLGYMAASDRLIAELEHPQGSKTFELQITVN